MRKENIFLFLIILFIILGIISNELRYRYLKTKIINNSTIIYDTFYDRTIIDCTKINIIKKDSIIYNIKQEAKNEIEEAINGNDSSTVVLFQDLLSK